MWGVTLSVVHLQMMFTAFMSFQSTTQHMLTHTSAESLIEVCSSVCYQTGQPLALSWSPIEGDFERNSLLQANAGWDNKFSWAITFCKVLFLMVAEAMHFLLKVDCTFNVLVTSIFFLDSSSLWSPLHLRMFGFLDKWWVIIGLYRMNLHQLLYLCLALMSFGAIELGNSFEIGEWSVLCPYKSREFKHSTFNKIVC